MPRFDPRANPSLLRLRRRRTDWNSLATMSALPSALSLSTTTISTDTPCAACTSDARHSRRMSRVFQETITTESLGGAGTGAMAAVHSVRPRAVEALAGRARAGEPVRVAIAGAGFLGRGLVNQLARMAGVQIVALADRHPEKLQSVVAESG